MKNHPSVLDALTKALEFFGKKPEAELSRLFSQDFGDVGRFISETSCDQGFPQYHADAVIAFSERLVSTPDWSRFNQRVWDVQKRFSFTSKTPSIPMVGVLSEFEDWNLAA
jgi:hypothetical protein